MLTDPNKYLSLIRLEDRVQIIACKTDPHWIPDIMNPHIGQTGLVVSRNVSRTWFRLEGLAGPAKKFWWNHRWLKRVSMQGRITPNTQLIGLI